MIVARAYTCTRHHMLSYLPTTPDTNQQTEKVYSSITINSETKHTYLKGYGDNDHRHEQGVLVHPLKHVPFIEYRPRVELVEDLAENERVEQNTTRRNMTTR